tara:strand:+ start:60 stop:347 length:288 start_codon:yes stop_codon:yes gene_type:complete
MVLLFHSCSTIKEGFTNPKKNSSDEFLVEKKSPLVMPPDFDELPLPKSSNDQILPEDSKIKDLMLTDKEKNPETEDLEDLNKSFEDDLLEKIKKN